MTNGLPSKPIPPSQPASRPFVLRDQPPAASLARATTSRAARETSGACPPTGNARRGKQTNNHPTTAPHKPPHHGHRPTTTAQESTTSPQAPRPTRPHRVTLLPTSTPGKKGDSPRRAAWKPCGQSTREGGAWYSPPFFAAQADATGNRSAVPGFGVRAAFPSTMRRHPKPTHRAPTTSEKLSEGRRNRQGQHNKQETPNKPNRSEFLSELRGTWHPIEKPKLSLAPATSELDTGCRPTGLIGCPLATPERP